MSHEIVLSVALSSRLHNVPELSLLTHFSFHCLLRPAEARQHRWCDVTKVDGSLSRRYEKVYGIVNIREPKRAEWQVMLLSNTCFWNVIGICQRINRDSIQRFGNSLLPNTSLISSDNSAALACHINITRSTDSEAVELPIVGFSIAIYHNYDAEVGGPLKGSLKDTSKKGCFHCIKTSSPKKLQTVLVLSRLVSFAAASNNGALPTPSRLSEGYLYHLVTWDENNAQADDAHDTSTDTLGWIVSSHAHGGRSLELFFLFWTDVFWELDLQQFLLLSDRARERR